MDKILFDELSKKIDKIIEKYDFIKKENLEKEDLLFKKEKEHFEIKKQLDFLIKERETIRKSIDRLVEKIDSLELF